MQRCLTSILEAGKHHVLCKYVASLCSYTFSFFYVATIRKRIELHKLCKSKRQTAKDMLFLTI